MAYSVVNVATPIAATSGTTATASLTLDGTEVMIIAAVSCVSRNASAAVTFNGSNMTAVGTPATGTMEARLHYYLTNPGAGSYNVVATADGSLSAGTSALVVHAFGVKGVLSAGPEGSPAGQSYGSTSSISDATTPSTALAMMVALLSVADPRTVTESSGQGTALSALDGTSALNRSRLYVWQGPSPAAQVTSAFSLNSNSGTNAQHLAAFGIVSASAPDLLGGMRGIRRGIRRGLVSR